MIAEVIVDILNSEVDRIFDYLIPENINVKLGARVEVPFGNRKLEGYVLNFKENSTIDNSKLKEILTCESLPVITAEMLELSKFLVNEYNLRIMDTLRLFLPSGYRNNKVKQIVKKSCTLNENFDISVIKKNAKSQLAILNYLAENKETLKSDLSQQFSVSAVNKLIEIGAITEHFKQFNRSPTKFDYQKKDIVLTDLQMSVSNKILNCKTKPALLFGVTGSGKTEVYMNCIKNVIAQGKTAIMLVPEISLTPQVLKQFTAKFGDEVAILHSGLSLGERFDEWHRILNGTAKVVVGARSAIFAPVKNLGIIIIDEEHDGSYISENNPRYATIPVATFRSKFHSCPLVLGSATPSVESYFLAKKGEYELLEMPVRVNNKPMPNFEIIDLRREISVGNTSMFSRKLIEDLCNCLANKKQAMIFLNRRGYNRSVTCRDCGYTAKCEHCDVSLVYHKEDNMLKCHYCNARYKKLSACPNCKSTYLNYGLIGTQKVVEELKKLFPKTKILRLDNDNVSGKDAHYNILQEFANSESSILVGTQMIAKGHDFPLVTLVGILDADLSLHMANYRATENTFQLITQVAGRAGRADYAGKVDLQTYMPRHFVYRCACNYDYEKFYNQEINIREITKFPPFSEIVRVLITSKNQEKGYEITRNIYSEMLQLKANNKNLIYLAVMKSPVGRIKDKFRFQVLCRIKQECENLKQNIFEICNKTKNKDISCFVEINPQNLS